jgi:hypothetical protein
VNNEGWMDANTPETAPEAMPGDNVTFRLNISNCGNVDLAIESIIDDWTGPDHVWSGLPAVVPAGQYVTGESQSITIISPEDCNETGWVDTIYVNASYGDWYEIKSDPAWYKVICPQNLYCGYTIGFWKENIDKYLCSWGESGRQVCDDFFESVSPQNDVCQYVAPELCSCGAGESCASWSCLYDRFTNKSGGCDNAKAQMAGILLTSQYYEGDLSSFMIDVNVCKETSGDGICDCYNDTCVSPTCKSLLTKACGGSSSCSVDVIWSYILSEYQKPNCGSAGAIADCVNSYEDFTDCSQYELRYCDGGSFEGSGCSCAFCHKQASQCYGEPVTVPTTKVPPGQAKKNFIQFNLLEPLFEVLL